MVAKDGSALWNNQRLLTSKKEGLQKFRKKVNEKSHCESGHFLFSQKAPPKNALIPFFTVAI